MSAESYHIDDKRCILLYTKMYQFHDISIPFDMILGGNGLVI